MQNSFWNTVLYLGAFGVVGWVIVSIVDAIVKVRTRATDARLEIERDYLRRMLTEIEDIKAELERQRDGVPR